MLLFSLTQNSSDDEIISVSGKTSERSRAPAFVLKLSLLFKGDRKKTGTSLFVLPVKKVHTPGQNGND